MSICFFTEKAHDGSGDIVQTLKTADVVQQWAETMENDVIIVVPDKDLEIAQMFASNINQKLKIKTMSEFMNSNPQVDCCIETGWVVHFKWKENLESKRIINDSTPMVYISEYDRSIGASGNNSKIIPSGFGKNQVGVIPSQRALNAITAPDEAMKQAYDLLSPTMKKYFGENYESFQAHMGQHGISYQYSHDRLKYQHMTAPYAREETPATIFLREHMMLTEDSLQSQDVFCFGEKESTKKEALINQLETLKQQGYSKVTFVNMDTDEEEVLHENNDLETQKEYRVLYAKQVPFATMQALPILATDIVGATGDNSLVEAMSAGKLVSYECFGHKKMLVAGYLNLVEQETTDPKVRELSRLLMKPLESSTSLHNYDPRGISELLKNREVVDELKAINQKIVQNSHYFGNLKEVVMPILIKVQHQIPITYVRKDNTTVLNFEDTPSSIHDVYLESLKRRYSDAYKPLDGLDDIDQAYFNKIRALVSSIESLDNPEQADIKSMIADWFRELPLEQQNRFRGEMPIYVDNIKEDYFDKLRPFSRGESGASSQDVVTNLMREIHNLHNPSEGDLLETIARYRNELSVEKQALLDEVLTKANLNIEQSPALTIREKFAELKERVQLVKTPPEPSEPHDVPSTPRVP